MKWKLPAAVILAAMLTWAASAGAVDGTIEINQAKVLAAGGFPYIIGASGSYRLTSDLTVSSASADAIHVTVNHVTIDLNGFSITTSSSGANGINGSSAATLTVENGTINGFGTAGVQVAINGIVRNVHADGNGSGIVGGNNTVIEGCTANNSTSAIGLTCSGGCAISGNTANGNNVGIECSGNGCVISGNTANANLIQGITCGGSGCLISGNTAFNNGTGIFANDATTGYGGNVLKNTTNISSGTSLGAKNTNLCTTGGVTSAC